MGRLFLWLTLLHSSFILITDSIPHLSPCARPIWTPMHASMCWTYALHGCSCLRGQVFISHSVCVWVMIGQPDFHVSGWPIINYSERNHTHPQTHKLWKLSVTGRIQPMGLCVHMHPHREPQCNGLDKIKLWSSEKSCRNTKSMQSCVYETFSVI